MLPTSNSAATMSWAARSATSGPRPSEVGDERPPCPRKDSHIQVGASGPHGHGCRNGHSGAELSRITATTGMSPPQEPLVGAGWGWRPLFLAPWSSVFILETRPWGLNAPCKGRSGCEWEGVFMFWRFGKNTGFPTVCTESPKHLAECRCPFVTATRVHRA